MLDSLIAQSYYDQAKDAATEPSKMACRSPDGVVHDVFVKYSWAQCPPGGLARELFSALLASELSISTATPALVIVEAEFLNLLRRYSPALESKMRGSVSPMYGSIYAGEGYGLCSYGLPEDPVLRRSAVEVWAFDQLILNPDRNHRKPNCLIKGRSLMVIDHEKALKVEGVGGFLLPAPWQKTWVPDANHLFRDFVGGQPGMLDRLYMSWKKIDTQKIKEIASVVPTAWGEGGVLEDVCSYMVRLHENLDAAFDNLREVSS